MNRTEAALYIKSKYAEYLQPAKKRGTFICPIPTCKNGTGADGDGLTIDPRAKNPYTLHCFKCGFHGDIIDLYQKEHDCDAKTAFNALYDYFGVTLDNRGENLTAEAQKEPQTTTTSLNAENAAEGEIQPLEGNADFMAYYEDCKAHITDEKAQNYLNLRGISQQTAAAHWIGYDPDTNFIIIPAAKSFYIARNADPAAKFRYNNPKGVSIELFNKRALYNEIGRPVFITEGAIDALSVIEAGGQAVALNSTSNTRKLIAELEAQRTGNTLILCLDNDDAGRKATADLIDGLKRLNISYITADITGDHKDPNEALTSDRGAFIEAIGEAERKTSKPDNTVDYIRRSMGVEIEALRSQAIRKTGFSNLDAQAGSIYSGLYIVGGVSSVGKTTFISQLADQMAEQGQHVLFFSMEQSRLEMVSKSIARQTAKLNINRAVSSLQIRTGADAQIVHEATTAYIEAVQDRVSIIEGNLACTVSYIGEYTRQYMAKNGGIRPVVIIDYLQIIQPDKDPDTGRKMSDQRQIVDYNVTQLKRMSRELEIPVFVISSLNRSNYLTPIDFESFKESGGIEYTCDVCWGLQLEALNDPIFNKEGKIKEKREKVAEAKEALPREVELICIKNRYGKSRYTAKFKYYPQYDYFEPIQAGATMLNFDRDTLRRI